MAQSATPPRSSKARRAKPPTPKDGAKQPLAKAKKPAAAAKSAAKTAAVKGGAKKVSGAAKSVGGSGPQLPKPNRLARVMAKQIAKKTAKAVARKTAQMGALAVRRAADGAAAAGRSAVGAGAERLLPIQLSIDVAVPINVAWEEWRSYGSLPEGIHRIVDIERDGDSLIGHTAGPHEVDWEAEVQDEREGESFAWRSVEGTDVAGLATFHQLSDRLTRIELDLDVVPTNPSEAVTLALHLAHRRAEADLRRFKAHVEFISPDAYEEHGDGNTSNGHANGRREKRPARKE